MKRAEKLRNDDTDHVSIPAQGYFLGVTDDELAIALDVKGKPQYAVFLKEDEAKEFLERFISEMEEKGWLQ